MFRYQPTFWDKGESETKRSPSAPYLHSLVGDGTEPPSVLFHRHAG